MEAGDDFVLKYANARDLISNLPSPKNVERDLSLIPSVQIAFELSTIHKLPKHIKRHIKEAGDDNIFKDDTLLGLCLNGQGFPVKIFLHDVFMMASDPSGDLFEEVAWHETVHGIEGIAINNNGEYQRDIPWSYKLQSAMLEIDKANSHEPDLSGKEEFADFLNYLRKGANAQDFVSELFARMAVMYMYHIKDTGNAWTSFDDFVSIIISEEEIANERKRYNKVDFEIAFSSFSKGAQCLIPALGQKIVCQISRLYGCRLG